VTLSTIHTPFDTIRRQNTNQKQTFLKLNTTQKMQTTQNSKTKLAWFSRFLRHSAWKRGGLIPQRSWAHTGHVSYCMIAKNSWVIVEIFPLESTIFWYDLSKSLLSFCCKSHVVGVCATL